MTMLGARDRARLVVVANEAGPGPARLGGRRIIRIAGHGEAARL
jgi:hypothetical protein